MKNIYTLLFASLLAFNASSQASFCEDFDSYTSGDPIAQTSTDWETWGSITAPIPPFADDAYVSNVMSNSGSNSLYLFSGATQGLQDVVLPFGVGTPYVLGVFEFTSMFYVNSGTGAYFNFQADNLPGTTWSLDCKMDLGTLVLENTGSSLNFLTTTYPEDVWFELKIVADLTYNIWELFIDGVSQGSFTNTTNQIASLDLYPIIGHEFYIDDICYNYTPATLPNLNAKINSISSVSGLAGQSRDISVDVFNFGINTITSFDVDFLYNGTTITENITGVNIPSVTGTTVSFISPITLTGGTNIGTATVSNVNGLGQDDDPTDDSMNTDVIAIEPTPGKLVIGEEATGTWCGWCPRGSVALNEMDRDYYGYFQGIAVHNGDPMTNTDYDDGLFSFHGGSFPSAVINREMISPAIDPSDFEQEFMQKIVTPISATFTGIAVASANIIDVEISTTVTSAISGNWTFACVLVEDSVTGSGGTWYQSNSYSANISLIDVDGVDWMNLPGWVPDAQMIYRHVGREILPSFGGGSLPSSTYNVGDVFTTNFQFTADPSWDINEMHVVGMLLNNGNIDNAVSLPVSINNNPVSVDNISSNVSINIFPNPAVSTTTLLMTIDTEKEVSVSVKSIEGKLIAKGNYGNMIGSHTLTFDVSNFSKGIYIVEVQIGNEIIVKKFIKE